MNRKSDICWTKTKYLTSYHWTLGKRGEREWG